MNTFTRIAAKLRYFSDLEDRLDSLAAQLVGVARRHADIYSRLASIEAEQLAAKKMARLAACEARCIAEGVDPVKNCFCNLTPPASPGPP